MAIENILAQIDAEIASLQRARAALTTLTPVAAKAGRKAKTATAKAKTATAKAKPRKKRVLSAEARKKIADAQHKRWAAVKAKAK